MKMSRGRLIKPLIIVLLLTLLVTYALPWLTTMEAGKTSAYLSIAFKGAGRGLDPQGNRFDINELKSEQILQAAISKSGLKGKVSAAELKRRVEILPQVQADTLKELLTLTSVQGKTQDIKERMLYPTSFEIKLVDRGMISLSSEKKLLNNILGSYREHLKVKYLADTAAEPAYSQEEILNMDYLEMVKVLNQEAESLLRYIGFYTKNEPQYVSEETGLSFSDVYQQALVIKDTDIANMRSIVSYYNLTKEPQNRIKYEQTLLKRAEVVAGKLKGAEYTTAEIAEIYDNNSNFIFAAPETDGINLTPLENQFYSDLMNALIQKKTSYIDAKYNQQDILRAISKLENGMVSEEERNAAIAKIKEGTETALKEVKEIKAQTKEMAEEFYDIHAGSKISISGASYRINSFGNIILNFVLLAAIAALGYVIYGKIKGSGCKKYRDWILKISGTAKQESEK